MTDRRAAVGAPEPVTWIEADGVRLATMRRGKGVPLLCLHATGHGARDFEALAERLAAAAVELIALDWPGQGKSAADREPASAIRYARLLDAVVPALVGDRQVVLLGNSIGGTAAIRFAHANPERVGALILCDPGGLAPLDPVVRLVIRAMIGFFDAGARGAIWFPRAFAAYYQMVLPGKAAAAQRARIVAAAPETAAVIAEAWRSFAEPAEDLRTMIGAIARPILFAWSRTDKIIALRRSRAAIETAPRGQLRLFEGGHSAFLEDPDAFAAAVIDFIL